ncbi:MAG TPA: ribbon-helix-helix domain-containing protein [Steroidobacteraceae bacterium]|nr:ribbon-helix-helix domain-containing protein [Steroidobacteraceae bacterium]
MATKKRAASKNRKPVNFKQIAAFVTPEQHEALKALSALTRIPQQAHLREAIDDLLRKYAKEVKR